MELIGKSFVVICKSWVNEQGEVVTEGWVSNNTPDLEKDVVEPETFAGVPLQAYFDRGAPVSSEHSTKDYPIGYMQKAALVRDGQVFQAVDNTRYPTVDFKYFNGQGTGWYGLTVIDDPRAAQQVAKGKVSSFSWIGMPKAWTPLPGGGRHFDTPGGIDPLLEATITAYPVNPTAIMRIAKSYGYAQATHHRLMLTPDGIERILSKR